MEEDQFPFFRHQVSGHSCLLWHEKTIYKPCTKLESEFYETLNFKFPALLPFTPKYFGVAHLPIKNNYSYSRDRSKDASIDQSYNTSPLLFEKDNNNNASNITDFKESNDIGYTFWGKQVIDRSLKKNKPIQFMPTLNSDSRLIINNTISNFKSRPSSGHTNNITPIPERLPELSPTTSNYLPDKSPSISPPILNNLLEKTPDISPPSSFKPDENTIYQDYIILEDLTSKYKYPCILDLKLGVRQHGLNESDSKIRSKMNKVKNSTSSSVGLRLCGMQVFNPDTKQYIFKDKYFGRKIDLNTFEKTLSEYFYNSNLFREDIIPLFIEKLEQFKNAIGFQTKYRFYSSSLLLVYEGDAPSNFDPSVHDDKTSPSSQIDVKLIDFAHATTTPPEEENCLDGGVLLGVQNLINLLLRVYHANAKSTTRQLPMISDVKLLWDNESIAEASKEIILTPPQMPQLPEKVVRAFDFDSKISRDHEHLLDTKFNYEPTVGSPTVDVLEMLVLPNGNIVNKSLSVAAPIWRV